MRRTQPVLIGLLVLAFALTAFAGGREVIPLRPDQVPQQKQNQSLRDAEYQFSWIADAGLDLTSNFGGWTGDYFFQYYVAPADGYLTSIDFNMSDVPDNANGGLSVQIFDTDYYWPEIDVSAIADGRNISNLGYYEEDGAFAIVGSNWVRPESGSINDVEGTIADKIYDPNGDGKVWPLLGAATVTVEPDPVDDADTVSLQMEGTTAGVYNFLRGDTFAVVLKFTGFSGQSNATEARMGFLSGQMDYNPNSSMKFYGEENDAANAAPPNGGRYGDGDFGWYIRTYVWDWVLNATLTGDRPPQISGVTNLVTTVSTAARGVEATVVDDNPGGGNSGVASVELHYSLDGGDYMAVAMTASGDVYSADIPGQAPGTDVMYKIVATDVEGLSGESIPKGYSIFQPTSKFLFLHDPNTLGTSPVYGQAYPIAYQWPYFYGYNIPSDTTADGAAVVWDVWDGLALGAYSQELLDNYGTIFYTTGFYPANVPDGEALLGWAQGATAEEPRNIFITGQDYGVVSAFNDTTFPAGSFEHDYLGIMTLGTQDIVEGEETAYNIDPVAGDPISGYLADAGGQLQYMAPNYGGTNWIDQMAKTDAATAFLTDPQQSDGPLGVYVQNGNFKGVYMQPDPYCLQIWDVAADTALYPNVTDYLLNIFDPVYRWFDTPYVGIDDEDLYVPKSFALGNAYPNPFNPSTSFEYTVAQAGDVNITVYNALGQEIATLVEGNKSAGTYMVNWDATHLASGVYFYSMTAPGFNATQKMLLLK